MFRFLPLIVKNSLRNRRRSTLTIASIAISLCLLGVLLAMYRALFFGDPTPAQALRLVTRHKVGLAQFLPQAYESKIRQVPAVRMVSTWQWFGGTYKDARDQKNFFARFAVEPEYFFPLHSEYTIPEDQKQRFVHERTACVASKGLADKFNWKINDRITLMGDIFPVNLELTLVGIYQDPEKSDSLEFNREYLRESLPVGSGMRDSAGTFLMQVDKADDVSRVAQAIDAMFDNSPAPTKTESEKAFQLSFASFLGNIKLFLMAICGAVTFTILLVSANTISMAVRERIREVGVMKTLGYTPGNILGIILGESAVISLIGGVIGTLMAAGLCYVVRQGPAFFQGMSTLGITPGVGLACLGVALFIGLVSSIVPAWSAARTSILDSLRYTG